MNENILSGVLGESNVQTNVPGFFFDYKRAVQTRGYHCTIIVVVIIILTIISLLYMRAETQRQQLLVSRVVIKSGYFWLRKQICQHT